MQSVYFIWIILSLFFSTTLLTGCGRLQGSDPVLIVQAFYEAINAEDIETIMDFLADESQIEFKGSSFPRDKWAFRLDLEFILSNTDNTFEVSNFEVDENQVFYDYVIRDGQQSLKEQGRAQIVVDGEKIISAHDISLGSP